MAVFAPSPGVVVTVRNGDDPAIAFDGPRATGAAAASDVDTGVSRDAWLAALGFIVVGLAAGWVLLEYGPFENKPFSVGEGVSLFAVFYVLAQAIERLLEPFSASLDRGFSGTEKLKETAEAERDVAFATALNDPGERAEGVPTNSTAAANAQATVERIARTRAVTLWGAATGLAALGAGYLNLQLLDTIGFASDVGGIHNALELLITALAIGGGTKPLHDLISKIQKSKDKDASTAVVS